MQPGLFAVTVAVCLVIELKDLLSNYVWMLLGSISSTKNVKIRLTPNVYKIIDNFVYVLANSYKIFFPD